MALSEKLQYLITVDSAGAVKGFQNVGKAADKELGKAESRLDKVGAGMVKFGAGALAAAGVAGAGLVKTANAFQDLAIESGKFANTTGLAVDQASLWIEVAGDMGVETATVEAALNKMNKTLGTSPALFEKYGVEIAKAADGTTDVNATFLNVVDRLNAIQDPAERAAAATALLGKGWTGMSELIATGSASLSQSLAQVSDAKVINPAELERAKDYRAAMDQLSDAMQDLVIGIGQGAAPVIGSLAEMLAQGVNLFSRMNDATGGAAGGVATFGVAALGAVGAASAVTGQLIKMRDAFSTVDEATGIRSLTTLGKSLGIVGGAIGLASIAYAVYSGRKKEAEQRTLDLAGALRLEAGAQNKALAELAANDAKTKEFLGTLNGLGLSVDSLTQYMNDGTGAVARFMSSAQAGYKPEVAQRFIDQLYALRQGALDQAAAQKLVTEVTGRAGDAAVGAAGDLGTLAGATDKAKGSADKLKAAWDLLKGEIDDDQAFLNLQDTFDDVSTKATEAWAATSEGAIDAEQKTREYQQSINNAKQAVIDYGGEVLGLPPEKVTELLLMIDQGKAAEVEQQLAILTRNRQISVELVKKGAIGWDVWVDPNGNRINARAAGGPVNAGDPYLVGEQGPELIIPATSGTVIPAAATQAMLNPANEHRGAVTAGAAPAVTMVVQGSIYGDQALRQTFAEFERAQRWKARVAG